MFNLFCLYAIKLLVFLLLFVAERDVEKYFTIRHFQLVIFSVMNSKDIVMQRIFHCNFLCFALGRSVIELEQ